MTYEVEFKTSTLKQIRKLPPQTAKAIVVAIDNLRTNPRKGNVRPMVGSISWRLRVGDYRVIYDIYDQTLVILILKVKHRRDVYKK